MEKESKIYTSQWLGGGPTMEYRFDLDGMSIKFTKELFETLAADFAEVTKNDYQKCLKVKKRNDKRREQLNELRKDLMDFMYGSDWEDSGWLFKKSAKEMREHEEAFDKIFEKYNNFFGIE